MNEKEKTLAETRHAKAIGKRKADKAKRREEPMLKWRMRQDVGNHTMPSDWPGENRVITPGMKIRARKSDLKGVRDKFEMISDDPDMVIIDTIKPTMEAEHVGAGRYKIKNAQGDYVSDETMSKEEADKIVKV